MEKKALDEVKLLWSGGPESRYEELLDVKATISALINATIFEHPTLARLCMNVSAFLKRISHDSNHKTVRELSDVRRLGRERGSGTRRLGS